MNRVILDAIVSTRTGEPLEEELKANRLFMEQEVKLNNASKMFEKMQESRETYEQVKAEWLKHESLYGETSYRLGMRDGIEIGREQAADRGKTFLSFEDMVTLVMIYEAVKKLNITMLGELTLHSEGEGVLGTLEKIYSVIEHGVSRELKLLDYDEVTERIISILDNDDTTAEEKAGRLLGTDECGKC